MWTQFVIILLFPIIRSEFVEVSIKPGRVAGVKMKTMPNGNRYYSFRGIPYAEPPGRFQPSVPKLPWKVVYNATEDQPICIQIGFNQSTASEDCLYLNVYTPSLPSHEDKLIPVMFWIHGGYFLKGGSESSRYAPDYFIDDMVVLVTINYRLGIFGFLSTGDDRVAGNNGLKDLILGLQWVQENIVFFNGDPSKVTIFGESAGAALVSYLTISPLTQNKGYFIGAICQSGNALSPWALQRHPARNYKQVLSKTFCRLFQIFRLDLFCLRHISTHAVISIETAVLGINAAIGIDILNGISFSPCYEVNTKGAALLEGSYRRLQNGSVPTVPIIMGINSEEGLAMQKYMPIIRPLVLQADLCKSLLVPDDMYATDKDKEEHIVPTITDEYFNKKPAVSSNDSNIIRFITDSMFVKPFREDLTLVRNRVPQYCYEFTYGGNSSQKYSEEANINGVGHAEELRYMWRNVDDVTLSSQDLRVKDKTVRLWTNFAKYGNPTLSADNDPLLDGIDWAMASVSGTDVNCLRIDDPLEMIKNPKEHGYIVWYNLYESFGHPNDTY